MSIPQELRIKPDTVVSVSKVKDNLGFYPNDKYLLVEIYGRIKLYKTRKMIQEYLRTRKDSECVAIRGFGSSGISSSVTMSHLMYLDRKHKREFGTFSAKRRDSKRKMTGIQIVIFPKIEE